MCEAGEYDADAVCRRLDVEFAIDHAALDSITAQTDSHTLSSAAVGQRHEVSEGITTARTQSVASRPRPQGAHLVLLSPLCALCAGRVYAMLLR